MPIVKVTNYLTPTGKAPSAINQPCLSVQTTWEVDDEEWDEYGEEALDGDVWQTDPANILGTDQSEVQMEGDVSIPSDYDILSEVTSAFSEYCDYQAEYDDAIEAGEEEPDMGDYIANYDMYVAIGACEALYSKDPQEMDFEELVQLTFGDNWKVYKERDIEVVG